MSNPLFQIAMFVVSMIFQQQAAEKARERQRRAQEEAAARADAAKGIILNTEGEAKPVYVLYGRNAVGGTRVYHKTFNSISYAEHHATGVDDFGSLGTYSGSKHEILGIQTVIGFSGINRCYQVDVDDKPVLDWGSDVRAHVDTVGGRNDPFMVANDANRSTALFTDTTNATLFFRLNRDDPQFGGVPVTKFYVEGLKVYTIEGAQGLRTLSAEKIYSNNPALCLLDYLLSTKYGRGLSVSKIDLESFYQAYLICEEVVMADVTRQGKLWIQKGGQKDIKRYEANIALDSSKPLRDNINLLLDTMGLADLVWAGGKYKLMLKHPYVYNSEGPYDINDVVQFGSGSAVDLFRRTDVWVPAVAPANDPIPGSPTTSSTNGWVRDAISAYIDDSMIIRSGENGVSWPDAQTRLNYATIKFSNENEDFAEDTVYWPVKNGTAYNTYRTVDSQLPLEAEFFEQGITTPQHATAKAEQRVRSSRTGVVYRLVLIPQLLHLEPGDFIKVTSTVLNIPGEIIKIDDVKITDKGTLEVSGVKYDANDLAWNVADDAIVQVRNVYNRELAQVTNLQLVPPVNGASSAGKLTWTAANDVRVIQYKVLLTTELTPPGPNTVWVEIGNTTSTSFELPSLVSQDYQFTVVAMSSKGSAPRSGWPSLGMTSNQIAVTSFKVLQIAIYKRSATLLNTPPTGGSYNFSTDVLTPPSGWSIDTPADDGNELYYSRSVIRDSEVSHITTPIWSTPVLNVGTNLNSITLEAFTRDAAVSPPTGGSWTFPNGPLTVPTDIGVVWHAEVPAGNAKVYVTRAVATSYNRTGANTNTLVWSTPEVYLPESAKQESTIRFFQWSTAMPSAGTISAAFDWTTRQIINLLNAGNWSVTIGANPGTPSIKLWEMSVVVSDYVNTATTIIDFSSPTISDISMNGEGTKSNEIAVFKWDVTPPAAPTGSGTLTWATLLFGAAPSGWSLVSTTGETPGYTLYKASIQISDVITATTTNFNWSSSIVQSIGYAGSIGADGADGAQGADGLTSRSIMLTSLPMSFSYNASGTLPSPSNAMITASAFNTIGTPYYEFLQDDVSVKNTTESFYVYTPPSSFSNVPVTFKVKLREDGAATTVLSTDSIAIVSLKDATDAISVVLSNATHGIATDSDGNNPQFTGSGCDIDVYRGTTRVAYGTGNDQYTVNAVPTNVTAGVASTVATYTRRYADLTAISADIGSLAFIVSYKNLAGVVSQYTILQTFSKIKAGVAGSAGANGANGAAGAQGNSYRTAYGKSSVATPNVVNSVQTSGSVSFPTEIYGLTSLVWSASVPTLSAGEYMYQLDGVYNPTTDLTYWATQPYWSTLKVGSLSALSANMGSITAGNIVLDTAGFIRGGQTDYATGTGLWLGYKDTTYKFSIGDATNYLKWDGSQLIVRGDVKASSVEVKSATTGAALYIKDDVIMVFDAAGVLRVKLGNLNASETR
jgi:hypothetical protein